VTFGLIRERGRRRRPRRPFRDGPAAGTIRAVRWEVGGFDRFFPSSLTQGLLRFTVTVRNHPWGQGRVTQTARGSVPLRRPPGSDDDESEPGGRTMPSEYAKALGARLRAIRTQQGLSLHGVEEKSRGRWKAVVVGSYERGDRAVTVQKLAELADFYGVPVSELLPGGASPSPLGPTPKLVIDLERLQQLPKDKAGPLARYAATI